MKNTRLKEIDSKLDFLIAKVDILMEVIAMKFNINIAEELKKAQQAEDDYYFDPTKYPNIEGNISETNEYFE